MMIWYAKDPLSINLAMLNSAKLKHGSIQHEAKWLSGSVSNFHATGPGFKSRDGHDRLSLSSLQWIDK
ncbi:hypothetical protein TNCV_2720951 [Trichonephila clavipes]|nr:hypothetical protein TNCV_2720951 [Trichonephila clavipes]